MAYTIEQVAGNVGSRPARGAWIEIASARANSAQRSSRPARGAWIEIQTGACRSYADLVAPRKGRVD